MNVLLINPSVGCYTRTMTTPLGLLSIGTYLKQAGHQVRLYDRCVEKVKLNRVMDAFAPDIVGISVMSSRGLKDAIAVSKEMKARGLTVVWGGQLPSMQMDLVIPNEYVDIVSFGEGEETWKELLDRIVAGEPYDDVLGIAYKKNGEVVCNPCRPFTDLSKLPDLDWSFIDVRKYMQNYLGYKKMMYLYSSKGCPGHCAFCQNVVFHKSTHRKRPNETVVKEIRYLMENYGLDSVYFSDELWCTKRADVQEFCRLIKEQKLPLHWGVDTRIGVLNEEDYRMMYDAGCRWVFFGIESGSREMQRRIHKNINYDKIKPTVEMLNAMGYTTIGSFIVGLPGETEEQLRDTTRMINELPFGLTPLFHYTPLPGTELYRQLVAEGKYQVPESLEELSHDIATESLGTNYSCVPDRDLKVIKNWYIWKSFTNKTAINNAKPFEFARETILSGLSTISMKGVVSFFVNGFAALNEFLYVFHYAHMFPEIRKKYELK